MNCIKKDEKEQRRFFFHYNKPESKKAGVNVLTMHWNNECILVNDIKCLVSSETHSRKDQPHCVVRGWAKTVNVIRENDKTLAVIS